ncbi:hypothetical protein Tco_0386066 [Tanacetum coccineum]
MTPPTFSLGMGLSPLVRKNPAMESVMKFEVTSKNKEGKVEKRAKNPSRFLVSSYMNKKTAIKAPTESDEVMLTDYLFSMQGDPFDFVFETKWGAVTIRDNMQTLAPQLKVEANVIDNFTAMLNYEEMMNNKGMKMKHFFIQE